MFYWFCYTYVWFKKQSTIGKFISVCAKSFSTFGTRSKNHSSIGSTSSCKSNTLWSSSFNGASKWRTRIRLYILKNCKLEIIQYIICGHNKVNNNKIRHITTVILTNATKRHDTFKPDQKRSKSVFSRTSFKMLAADSGTSWIVSSFSMIYF